MLFLSPAGHGKSASRAAAAFVASQPPAASPAVRGRIQASYAALPLAFEQNQGQTDAQVQYMARGDGYTLFLTANDAVFALQSRPAHSTTSKLQRETELRAKNPGQRHAQENSTAVVRMQLAGGNSLAKVSASGELPGRSNYFLGNDPTKWHTDVPHYARVSYQDVYPGVNLAFHGAQRQTEFDFVVAPGANPAPIGFNFTGAQGIQTDDSGNLVISSAAGDVLLHKPVAYQEQNGVRQPVDARFVLRSNNLRSNNLKANNQVSFELGNYDRSRELVIDPSVSYEYSTYLGGTGDDEGQSIAFDSNGNAYVTGETASTSFPGASGSLTGAINIFVTEIKADGSALVYSTYVGGNGSDSGNGIAVDALGNAFVAGGSTSTNFPTASPFQNSLAGTRNAVVFELLAGGSTLAYSTYLGGTGDDTALGIALDQTTNAYAVAGKASSTDFPTHNPLQVSLHGTSNGFVSLWNSSNTRVYSTYLGGGTGDAVFAVALDSSDNAYVTGQTFSTAFPVHSPLQATCGSCSGANSNAFVTVYNPTGSAYVYSTFLGGSGGDEGDGIAVDSTGNAYVTGTTTSSNFPTTTGVLQATYAGDTDAFITKVNSGGGALAYSTYLGGTGFDAGASIAVDTNGNAYVTGQTSSSAFPIAGATQSTLGGANDAFVSELDATGTALVFSTYLGGTADEDDGGNYGAIAVDSAGANIYVTGNTASTNFPTTLPYQSANKGGTDAFIVKYSQPTTPAFTLSATALSPSSVSPGGSATSTIMVTSDNGFSSTATVTLTCAITGPSGAVHPPTCGAASATSAASGTITVSTTAATSLMQQPATGRSSAFFYAMFLPIGGMALLGLGSTAPRRKRWFSFLLLGLVLSSLFLMPACGGGSSGGGGGGGAPGTTAGTYTITVSGTASGAAQAGNSPALTLTVN
jgi:hypothetical protein